MLSIRFELLLRIIIKNSTVFFFLLLFSMVSPSSHASQCDYDMFKQYSQQIEVSINVGQICQFNNMHNLSVISSNAMCPMKATPHAIAFTCNKPGQYKIIVEHERWKQKHSLTIGVNVR